jgi:cytochrome b561
MKNTASGQARYALGPIVLHWLIAGLIALNFAAAWVAEVMPKPQAVQVMANRKAIGLTIPVALRLGDARSRRAEAPVP